MKRFPVRQRRPRGACPERWAAWALAFAAVLAGCESGDIAVFSAGDAGAAGELSDAGDGTSGAGADAANGGDAAGGVSAGGAATDSACFDNADCPPTSLCSKETCEAVQGVCSVRPPVCFDTTPSPVCGCNHVTYWNDCLRQQYGVSAAMPGPCGTGARSCYGNNDCKGGATCSHLLPPDAPCGGPPGPGTCWVAPADCSATGDKKLWSACAPPGSTMGPTSCASTCEAVKAGRPFTELAPGTACPAQL